MPFKSHYVFTQARATAGVVVGPAALPKSADTEDMYDQVLESQAGLEE